VRGFLALVGEKAQSSSEFPMTEWLGLIRLG
jgi:hypothetical protein